MLKLGLDNLFKGVHSLEMHSEQRKDIRFDDIGRVDAPDICVFPGVLVDISMLGCKIRFPASVQIDIDIDYEIKVTPARKDHCQPFTLIGHPMWQKVVDNTTELGFSILRSPSTRQLIQYIERLALEEADFQEEELINGQNQ